MVTGKLARRDPGLVAARCPPLTVSSSSGVASSARRNVSARTWAARTSSDSVRAGPLSSFDLILGGRESEAGSVNVRRRRCQLGEAAAQR